MNSETCYKDTNNQSFIRQTAVICSKFYGKMTLFFDLI